MHCIPSLPVIVNTTEQSFTSDSSVSVKLLLLLLLLLLDMLPVLRTPRTAFVHGLNLYYHNYIANYISRMY